MLEDHRRRLDNAGSGPAFPDRGGPGNASDRASNIDWNTGTVTAAYAPYYRKTPCAADVLACRRYNLRYANSHWKKRSVHFLSGVIRERVARLFGRVTSPEFACRNVTTAGYVCEALAPTKDMDVLEVDCMEGVIVWQLDHLGARTTGVEVSPTACAYSRSVLGIDRIVQESYSPTFSKR